ncbi:unnamed protein product, partial [marine sediment metagenome]
CLFDLKIPFMDSCVWKTGEATTTTTTCELDFVQLFAIFAALIVAAIAYVAVTKK